MNDKYSKVIDQIINIDTLTDVENYGYCHLSEVYTNDIGQEIKIEVYELDSRTYLIRYVDDECVEFRDITTSAD
jgi:hypothetical protein